MLSRGHSQGLTLLSPGESLFEEGVAKYQPSGSYKIPLDKGGLGVGAGGGARDSAWQEASGSLQNILAPQALPLRSARGTSVSTSGEGVSGPVTDRPSSSVVEGGKLPVVGGAPLNPDVPPGAP